MIRRPPEFKLTDTLLPYATLCRFLVRLRRQSPARAIEHQRDRRLAIGGGLGIVLGLDQEMAEIPSFQRRRIDPVLRPDQLQFVAFALDDLAPRLDRKSTRLNSSH